MTKEEFEGLVGKTIPSDEWRAVENVYTNSTFSKDTVAAMYIEAGVSVFLALQDFAGYKKSLEADLRYFKQMIDLTNERISRVNNGDYRIERAIWIHERLMTAMDNLLDLHENANEISESDKIMIANDNIYERFGRETFETVRKILDVREERD